MSNTSNTTVLSQESKQFFDDNIKGCRIIPPKGCELILQVFSEGVQKKHPKDLWAGVFKYMLLQAFKLNFSAEKVAEICRGLSQISGLDSDDIEILAVLIADGIFDQRVVDFILTEHYKIEDLVFEATSDLKALNEAFLVDLV